MKCKYFLATWGLLILVIMLWGTWAVYYWWQDTPSEILSYDSLTTLFTGCAFWGAWMAYRTQCKGVEKAQEQTQIAKEQIYNAALFEYLSYMQQLKKELRELNHNGNDWLCSIELIKETVKMFRRIIRLLQQKIDNTGPLRDVDRDVALCHGLMFLRINLKSLKDWGNIIFEWKQYIETSDLDSEKKKQFFFRLFNQLSYDERFAIILVGVYTEKIKKGESIDYPNFSDFKEFCKSSCGVSSKPVIDIMFDLLASSNEIYDIRDIESIIFQNLQGCEHHGCDASISRPQ